MDGFYSSTEHTMPGVCNSGAPGDAKTETFPFDLHGELEDAYDAAEVAREDPVKSRLRQLDVWALSRLRQLCQGSRSRWCR